MLINIKNKLSCGNHKVTDSYLQSHRFKLDLNEGWKGLIQSKVR
jgi:hypothetical protein